MGMITPLLALVHLFTAADPCLPLLTLQQFRPCTVDLRDADPRVVFQPAAAPECRYISVAFRYEYDARSASYFRVYKHLPEFFSDATVANHDRGLMASLMQ
jgi:hypothetical protein